MINSQKKVAICIPCYNEEKFISDSVASVLNQTYRNLTLHIIDNKSTDKTLAIVRKLKDPRIIIHTNKTHVSMFDNMNRCLAIKNVDYIKILCADDFLEKTCIEKQVRILDQHERVGLVFNASNVVNNSGKIVVTRNFASSNGKIKGKELIKRILISGRNPIGEPSCLMFRKEIIDINAIKYDSAMPYSGDLDVVIQLLKKSHGYYLSEPLNSFRIHTTAGSTKLIHRVMREQQLLLKKYELEIKLSIFDKLIFLIRSYVYYVAKLIVFSFFAK
jgi:glycosyltransferase involved in cell wall biosynthesis